MIARVEKKFKFLDQKTASQVDKELVDTYKYSIDILMELAGKTPIKLAIFSKD